MFALDLNVTEVYSWRSNHQYDSIGSSNDVAPNRRQVRASTLITKQLPEQMLIICELDKQNTK